jgi:preprotein translocase subunit YajC
MEEIQKFLPIILMFVVIYFLMIRPQQKRQKLEKEFEKGLKVGDKIITKSGIHGRITELTEDTAVIETMAGKIKMERSAISLELSRKVNSVAKQEK